MDFLVRRAAVSDAHALALVKENVWHSAYKDIYPKEKLVGFDLAAQAQYFARLATDSCVSLFVAEVQGRCVGYMAAGEKTRRSVGQNAEILLLNIDASYRKQGIGRALFAQGAACLRAKGFSSFIVACNKYNYPAHVFYRKMGGVLFAQDADAPDRSLPQVYFRYTL